MSDYFNNLLVRSFKPVTAVQPLDAPPLHPSPNALDRLAPPTSEEFIDPFTDPGVSTKEQGQLQPYGIHSLHDEQQLRPPDTIDKAPSEPPPVVSNNPVATIHQEVESKAEPQPAAPRRRDISRTADKPLSSSKPFAPPKSARPVTGEALRPLNERPPESLRPTLAAAADKAKGNEPLLPAANESGQRVSPLPAIASVEQVEAMPQKKNPAAEKVSPPNPLRPSSAAPFPLPPIEMERRQAVVERIVEPSEKQQSTPAPLSTLIPKPGEGRAAVAVKAQPNLIRPSAPDKVAAEVSQPETIINVTIGRIEVRATPAQPSRPERHRSAPQVMTLDDYLRKRSGGNP